MADNPHREEIAGYLRRAECHYGHTLNELEAGLTVAESVASRHVLVPRVAERGLGAEQVTHCREAVARVLDGEDPGKSQAGYDEAVYRSLLHFRDEMSPELHQYVVTRLGELQSRHKIAPSVKPLRCYYPAWEPLTLTAPADTATDPASDGSAAIDEADVYVEYGSAEVALSGPASVEQVHVDKVLPAALKTELFEVKAMAERMASQPEAELGQRFEQYLSARGRQVCCFAITLPDGTVLTTDRCDVDGGVLYEAKSSADRMSVRLALGQVLDYGHHVGRVRADLRLAILLSAPPAPDLVELLQSLGVGCVVEGPLGVFGDLYADANGNDFCP
ncbi:hypothetical protein [Mycobacteroides abscessus]|uniref:hypothetical protein n=1 Tax=Mycobacteroides abscessus TaxID=36809 RepID=UPI000925FBCC|nr:hypothetical protein [Mycobacteroides abscessus]MBN7296622.1 hypothetical protein [Mycobacteroides abscessus subsp. abscessus]SHR98143.1 Uncharacterised protein [Mycobacteroides abscessus subsp. abscessus]